MDRDGWPTRGSVRADSPSSKITDTTRAPRPGETNGFSYHFVTRDDFVDLVKRDGFIEHAEFSGNMYGTSVQAVEDVKKGGKMCILDIDTQVRSYMYLASTMSAS